ncbi:unnamed protein product, partial [Brenthis ino]
MQECGYCKEKEMKLQKYEEEIETEKSRECLKALEREKIANGMRCTKSDEKKLREIQKMQMREKKSIEQQQADIDKLWHKVLIDNVKTKEQQERVEKERLKQEMIERRLAYDEQIASANKLQRELLQKEREIENRRLEKMKKKMEQDYYDAMKRKKEQELKNRKNFIEGHQIKLSNLRSEKIQERNMDINTINIAMEELRKERQKKLEHIQSLNVEKRIFVENYKRERKMADQLEKEAERIANEWKEQGEKESDEFYRNREMEKLKNRMSASQEYRRHIEDRNQQLAQKKEERKQMMERVRRTAYSELRRNLDSANEEMRRQIEYQHALTNQIRDNDKIMEMELNEIEEKQRAFTKKSIMFRDAMRDKTKQPPCENPVHPFRKILQAQETSSLSLPLINRYGY